MSCQSSEDITLLECFPVPEVGVFSVSVYEVQHDGMVGYNVWRLPHVIVSPDVGMLVTECNVYRSTPIYVVSHIILLECLKYMIVELYIQSPFS